MPTARRHRRPLARALAATLLLAACGGGDDDDVSAASTAAPEGGGEATAPSSTVPASADDAHKARAEAAVLRLADFPDGWEEHDPTEGLALELTWNDLLACLKVEKAADPPAGIAVSPTFLQGIGTQARSTVEYVSGERQAAIAAAFTSGDFNACVVEVFTEDATRSAPEGGVPGPLTVTPLELPSLGTSTSATRVAFEMRVGDLPIPISQDLIVVFEEGGTVNRLGFLNPGGPFAPNLQKTLVEAVVARS